MSAGSQLFEPITVGGSKLRQRIAMAPLTRYRATDEHVPSDIAAEYYDQRSSTPGSLIITEGTFINSRAGGYPNVPGMWSQAQIEGWKKVVDRVHANGSFIYLQLWALGRAAQLKVLEKEHNGNAKVVSASNITLGEGDQPTPLTEEEIKTYVEWYAQAARNFVHGAKGDGVEVHSANGYLLDQFLQTNSNKREDAYGGSVENRTRFTLQVVDAITKAVGESSTAIRISPFSTFQDMRMADKDIKETYRYLVTQLKERHPQLAYLHLVLPRVSGNADVDGPDEDIDFIYNVWKPLPIVLAGGLTPEKALEKVTQYENSIVAFGRYFISNPDLPLRIKNDIKFSPYNRDTFYLFGPDKTKGYIDYPFLKEEKVKA